MGAGMGNNGAVDAGPPAVRPPLDTFTGFAGSAPVGILMADAAGMCTYANPAWCAMTGFTLEETLGLAWSAAVHPDDLPATMAAWAASIETGRPYLHDLRVVRKDGAVRRVIAQAVPSRDERGTITGYVGTAMDVTPLWEARRLLEERERILRRLIEVQEEERRSLCNDFHDGLMQAALAAQMLLEGYQLAHCPAGRCAELEAIVAQLRRGIADARRTISGIRSTVLDDFGLVSALDDLADQAAEFGITVLRAVDPRIDAESSDRQTTIYRVVQEALTNVRKHAGVGEARLEIRCGDDGVELVVEDRGRGFDPAAVRPQAFGLVGMAERVRLAGGTCRVESRPGGGTRICVHLPRPAGGCTAAAV